jgi:hypothetical protein
VKTFRQRAIEANAAERDRANTDPKALWTGYEELAARMMAGREAMVEGVAVLPATPEQYVEYNRLQNMAPALGYERRPPAPHGASCVHLHFERRPDA